MENNYKFYKEGKNWYVDLPDWPGDKASLQMVAGADDMLDLLSEGTNEVTLKIKVEHFDGCDTLRMTSLAEDLGEGAYYVMETYKGNVLNLEMWLCGVTKFVFGEYPEVLYISKKD